MKNILLTFASLILILILTSQEVRAEEEPWPPQTLAQTPERGNTEDGDDIYNPAARRNTTAARIKERNVHPDVCDSCLPNTVDAPIWKKTDKANVPTTTGTGSGSGGKSEAGTK